MIEMGDRRGPAWAIRSRVRNGGVGGIAVEVPTLTKYAIKERADFLAWRC